MLHALILGSTVDPTSFLQAGGRDAIGVTGVAKAAVVGFACDPEAAVDVAEDDATLAVFPPSETCGEATDRE